MELTIEYKTYDEQFSNLITKLSEFLQCEILFGNQIVDKPKYPDDYEDESLRGTTKYPFVGYTIQSVERVANIEQTVGVDEQSNKKEYHEQYEFTIVFTAVDKFNRPFGCIDLISKIQEWFSNLSHYWLQTNDMSLVSTTSITPKDFLFIGNYERRNEISIKLRLGRKAEVEVPAILKVTVNK